MGEIPANTTEQNRGIVPSTEVFSNVEVVGAVNQTPVPEYATPTFATVTPVETTVAQGGSDKEPKGYEFSVGPKGEPGGEAFDILSRMVAGELPQD